LRYAITGRGKSGGVRAIYYFKRADDLIYMLVVYPKSKKDDLSPKQIEQLRKLVKELWHGKDVIQRLDTKPERSESHCEGQSETVPSVRGGIVGRENRAGEDWA
jgi:hypothetical protein